MHLTNFLYGKTPMPKSSLASLLSILTISLLLAGCGEEDIQVTKDQARKIAVLHTVITSKQELLDGEKRNRILHSGTFVNAVRLCEEKNLSLQQTVDLVDKYYPMIERDAKVNHIEISKAFVSVGAEPIPFIDKDIIRSEISAYRAEENEKHMKEIQEMERFLNHNRPNR